MERDAEIGINDPHSRTRMVVLALGVHCIHLQCFLCNTVLADEQKKTNLEKYNVIRKLN